MRHVFYDKEMEVIRKAVQPSLDNHTVVIMVHYFFTNSNVQNEQFIHEIRHEIQEDMLTNVPRKIKKIVQLASHKNRYNALSRYDTDIHISCSGRVAAIGREVRHVSVGDWVACIGMGYAHYADLICVINQNVVRIDSRTYVRMASMIAPGISALQAIKKAQLSLGDRVALFGLNTVGLFMIQFARMAGCTVIAIDNCPKRLMRAKEGGADYVYQTENVDVADIAIITDMAEQKSMMHNAIDSIRTNGRLLVMGKPIPEIDFFSCHKKQIELDFFCEWKSELQDNSVCVKDAKANSDSIRTFMEYMERGVINMNAIISEEQSLMSTLERISLPSRVSSHLPIRFAPSRHDMCHVGFVSENVHAKSQMLSRLARIQQGKALFLEKPMATSFEELDQWRIFLGSNPQALFCVNYSYAYASFVQRIKAIVATRTTPLTIIYRMNNALMVLSRHRSIQYRVGSILGDASAIIDLFCFLTNARPIAVSVETMGACRDTTNVPTQNFSAHIRFDDGSVCTLVYTSVGHPDIGQERMEVFVDGKTMVIDDYLRLSGFGLPLSFGQMALKKDKGEWALRSLFFEQIKQKEFVPPIAFDRLLMVAELSLIIDDLVCYGGGDSERFGFNKK